MLPQLKRACHACHAGRHGRVQGAEGRRRSAKADLLQRPLEVVELRVRVRVRVRVRGRVSARLLQRPLEVVELLSPARQMSTSYHYLG